MNHAICLKDVTAAYERVRPHVHRTPVVTCSELDRGAAAASGSNSVRLHFKCELFQKTGSFKARGATNAVLSLHSDVRAVATHSSGNHAAALAYAAARRPDTVAHIVMPSNAPAPKKAATRGYGAQIRECAPTQAAREAAAAEVCKETGAEFVHPSEDKRVIAGQGTLALELLEECPELDVLVVPVGGGGMISGCAVAAKGVKPSVRIIGAEPAGADDAYRSKVAGALLGHASPPATMADGLRTTLGPNTWPIVRDLVDAIVTVQEDEISAALGLVYSRAKLAIEPSAAVGVAAVLSPRFWQRLRELDPELGGGRTLNVGVVLCGGNVDLADLMSAAGVGR